MSKFDINVWLRISDTDIPSLKAALTYAGHKKIEEDGNGVELWHREGWGTVAIPPNSDGINETYMIRAVSQIKDIWCKAALPELLSRTILLEESRGNVEYVDATEDGIVKPQAEEPEPISFAEVRAFIDSMMKEYDKESLPLRDVKTRLGVEFEIDPVQVSILLENAAAYDVVRVSGDFLKIL